MLQTELCFNITSNDTKVSSPDWRKKLASLGDGVLPPWFFGRDEEGVTLTEFPKIRFLGGKRALRIAAFGEDASGELEGLMPTLFKLMNKAGYGNIPVRMNEYKVGAKPSYQHLYHVNAPMLLQRVDRSWRLADETSPEVRNNHVKSGVIRGLVRQANFFGLDFPPDDEIDLVQCGPFRFKRVHSGFRYGVQYAVIGMPVELSGIWQSGLLLSHGHGTTTPYHLRSEDNRTEESKAAA